MVIWYSPVFWSKNGANELRSYSSGCMYDEITEVTSCLITSCMSLYVIKSCTSLFKAKLELTDKEQITCRYDAVCQGAVFSKAHPYTFSSSGHGLRRILGVAVAATVDDKHENLLDITRATTCE